MDLSSLKLDRQMYKISPMQNATESPVYMSSDVDSIREVKARKSSEKDKKDAREVITGTVITACLIKSSDQDDRIEIGQNLDSILSSLNLGSLNFTQAKGLDYLAAYRPGGRLGFLLTGIGALYIGYSMDPIKVIGLINGQTGYIQTQSEVLWNITTIAPGAYSVNHNLNSLQYAPMVQPYYSGALSVPVFATVTHKGLNSFYVELFDDTGAYTPCDFDCIVNVFK